MKILVRPGGFSNKGHESMLRTVQLELGRRIPDSTFYTRVPKEEAQVAYGAGFVPSFRPASDFSAAKFLLRSFLAKPHVLKAASLSLGAAHQIASLDMCDCVVDTSGYGYSDAQGAGPMKLVCAWLDYCVKTKKAYVFMPQSWGPFTNKAVLRYLTKIGQKASLIYARDEQSLNYLQEVLKTTDGKVRLGPDLAFRLPADTPAVGKHFLARIGVNTDNRPIIGLAPNMRVYERMEGIGADNEYCKLLKAVAKHFAQEYEATIVLIPHELNPYESLRLDDRFLCGMTEAALSGQVRYAAIYDYVRPQTLRSVISQLDFLIGSRFHCLLHALASRVPVFAIGWSHKYQDLLKLVGLNRSVVSHKEAQIGRVIAEADVAWQRRKDSKLTLEVSLPIIEKAVDNVFDNVTSILS